MIHVYPVGEEHEESTTCKCCPSLIFENGEMIVIHNSFMERGLEGWKVKNQETV